MEKLQILPLIFFTCFLFSAADDHCRPSSCGPTQPQVRFPFRLIGRQPSRCGFPGFDLRCDQQNLTVIRLPSSRSYIVKTIDYVSQAMFVDPGFCGRNGINSVNLTDTPFDYSTRWSCTFYNCSLQSFGFMYPAMPFTCLSSSNYSVIAVPTGLFSPGNMPENCEIIRRISVPARWNGDIRSELQLMWFAPFCRACENEGHACGWMNDNQKIGCLGSSSSHGLPTRAKYGLSVGIGAVCIIGLICYTAFRVRRNTNESHHQSIDLFSIAVLPRQPTRTGLDGPTIESYPKTMLGESGRLPSDDSTCAICLSDYKPKESLRTIPECNHYFHADCIDEWLKLNATCPVCRNSPESSSLVTPCSSTSTNSVNSS